MLKISPSFDALTDVDISYIPFGPEFAVKLGSLLFREGPNPAVEWWYRREVQNGSRCDRKHLTKGAETFQTDDVELLKRFSYTSKIHRLLAYTLTKKKMQMGIGRYDLGVSSTLNLHFSRRGLVEIAIFPTER